MEKAEFGSNHLTRESSCSLLFDAASPFNFQMVQKNSKWEKGSTNKTIFLGKLELHLKSIQVFWYLLPEFSSGSTGLKY